MKLITALIFTITMQGQSDGYHVDNLINELSNMKRPMAIVRDCGTPPLELTLKKGLNQNGHNLELINTHLIAYGSKKKGKLILKCGAKVTVRKPKNK